MTWLFENPYPALLAGGITAVSLGFGWVQTGRRWPLNAMIVVLVLTFAALLLERSVVTDREKITATLHRIAALLERNAIDDALEYAHSGSPEVRDQAQNELPRYEFFDVKIKRNLKIDVSPEHVPPKAVAEFNVTVVASTRDGSLNNIRAPRFVKVVFLLDNDGTWRVAEYDHYDPRRGFMERD